MNFREKEIEIPTCFTGAEDLLTGRIIELGEKLLRFDVRLIFQEGVESV